MSSLKYPILLTALLALSGCGAELVEDLCRYDSNCATSQYCVDFQCVDACVEDDECASGRRCLSYQRSGEVEPIEACLIDERTPGDVQCESDAQCQEELASQRVFCGLDGRCAYIIYDGDTGVSLDAGDDASDPDASVDPGESVLILIEQVWPEGSPDEEDAGEPFADVGEDAGDVGEDAGDVGEDAGNADSGHADVGPAPAEVAPVRVGAVIARSPSGNAEAYGRVLRWESARSEPDEPYLQAAPVALDDDEICVQDASQARYTSLGGPGGWLLVELVDGYGDPLSPRQDWTIEIIADSPVCPLGYEVQAPPDLPTGMYRARVCTGAGDRLDPQRDCSPPASEARQGFTEFIVTL
ncbi:hypothetical protein DL240_16175 [Lujinxingia litoralis]|uniref:Uncharacterized protein n=1 Tax=Lujinxingia litoralis TaxID=2211119 RepID=A0A328C5J2_9DELT|nr:hypothetical protein [Lujinxingia litoralis]RAL20573.1 hypothetical protein DL240_16175 [Lujinxingia litoralis]